MFDRGTPHTTHRGYGLLTTAAVAAFAMTALGLVAGIRAADSDAEAATAKAPAASAAPAHPHSAASTPAASSVAAETLHAEGLRAGAVGFCWGGSVAFLANTRLGLPAVSYYGARTLPFLDEPLRAPMMFHFGETDSSIPPAAIEQHRRKQPHATIHLYAGAGHAFNRDVDNHAYAPAAAETAWRRTLDFLQENLR